MSDLISRKALLKRVIEANPMGGMIGSKFIEDLIKNAPTAYDVDKVVAQLEGLKADRESELHTAEIRQEGYMLQKCFSEAARAYGKSIKIVKGGGVDESISVQQM